MREIKFRGKRKDNGEWVYGDVIHFPSTTAIGHPDKDGVCWEEYDVIPETVGQSTGLKDKNDVEIYDGDVFRYYPDLYNSIHIVEWGLPIGARLIKKGSARWPEQYLHCMASRNIEIIGTIHDKPEKNTNQGSESARDSVGPADSEK